MIKVGIIDYGGGNLRSLKRAVESLGHTVTLVDSPDSFEGLSHILYPGQGAYGDCLKKLRARNLQEPLLDWIAADKPFFGICVGYQLLFSDSEEAADEKGFQLIDGNIIKFRSNTLKIPHMGWNALEIADPSHKLWDGLSETPYFYFVHSYYSEGVDPSYAAASCNYGEDFTACVIKGNLFATQFHPEKSQENGLKLIENFLS